MDQQSGGVGLLVATRGVVTAAWVIVSTIAYSIPCFLLAWRLPRIGVFFSRVWARQMMAVAGVRIRTHGLAHVAPGDKYIFVSNHQSHFDIPSLFAVLPHRLAFAAKKELFRIPFFGWGITAVGHIQIDRSSARKARESLTRAVNRLKTENISTVIFPEGTRSENGNIGEFKRGSFTMAVESGLPVVPIYIDGTLWALPKKTLLARPGDVTITFGEPIPTIGLNKEELSTRVRAAIDALAGTAPERRGPRAQ